MRPLASVRVAGLLAALVLGCATSVPALTVAPGSETLFTQLEMSDTVVLAHLRSAGPDGLRFAVDEVLRGTAGAEVLLRDPEALAASWLRPEEPLLLMLTRAEDGSLRLALEDFSLFRVPAAELPAALDAARAWLRDRADREQSRATLVRLAGASSAFLQHSALMGLMNLGLMDRTALQSLIGDVAGGRIADPQDRQLIVRFAGVLGASEHQGFLTARVRDASESSGLREAALLALDALDPTAARALAPDVERSGTPELQELMRSLGR